jgi:hypothetical protein
MMKRASVLKMQCKKYQVFREHLAEAMKMAEAGQLHLQIAAALHAKTDVKKAGSSTSRRPRLAWREPGI